MALKEVISQIDAEIARLQQAKSLLVGSGLSVAFPEVRGSRPKKKAVIAAPAKKKRTLSPEGRARIAEAVKRRWAAQKTKQKSKE